MGLPLSSLRPLGLINPHSVNRPSPPAAGRKRLDSGPQPRAACRRAVPALWWAAARRRYLAARRGAADVARTPPTRSWRGVVGKTIESRPAPGQVGCFAGAAAAGEARYRPAGAARWRAGQRRRRRGRSGPRASTLAERTGRPLLRSQVARHGPALGRGACAVVGHHADGLPVAGAHHVVGRGPARGQLAGQRSRRTGWRYCASPRATGARWTGREAGRLPMRRPRAPRERRRLTRGDPRRPSPLTSVTIRVSGRAMTNVTTLASTATAWPPACLLGIVAAMQRTAAGSTMRVASGCSVSTSLRPTLTSVTIRVSGRRMANVTTLVSRATAWMPSRSPVTVAGTPPIADGFTIQVVSGCPVSTSSAPDKRNVNPASLPPIVQDSRAPSKRRCPRHVVGLEGLVDGRVLARGAFVRRSGSAPPPTDSAPRASPLLPARVAARQRGGKESQSTDPARRSPRAEAGLGTSRRRVAGTAGAAARVRHRLPHRHEWSVPCHRRQARPVSGRRGAAGAAPLPPPSPAAPAGRGLVRGISAGRRRPSAQRAPGSSC